MYCRSVKRILDLAISVPMLIVLLPFLTFIVFISLVCHGPGNIFFLQQRIGWKGIPFRIVKFKTMTDARDGDGNLLPDADRQTVWGTIMRKYSLDELLQLINVIKGDMSVVGPRPLVASQVENLTGDERTRFNVRPGITGLAQVCGRNDISFYHKFRYDAWYVHHLSLLLDLQILIMTVKVVVSGYGVEYDPSVEQQFMIKKN